MNGPAGSVNAWGSRALSIDPDLLIADEAVSALDAETLQTVLQLLAEIQRDSDLPILLITHDFAVVTAIAHHVAVMLSGRIVEQGPVADVLDSPRNGYTRTLIAAAQVAGEPMSRRQ